MTYQALGPGDASTPAARFVAACRYLWRMDWLQIAAATLNLSEAHLLAIAEASVSGKPVEIPPEAAHALREVYNAEIEILSRLARLLESL